MSASERIFSYHPEPVFSELPHVNYIHNNNHENEYHSNGHTEEEEEEEEKKNSVKSSDIGIGIVVVIVLFISLVCVCMCAAACTSKSERTQTTTLPSSFENPNIVVSTIDLYRTFECTKEDPISKHTWHQGPPDVHSYLATDADTTAIIYSKS
jgi:uncharacterized membrane protein YkgB